MPIGNDSGGSQGNLQTGDGEFNQLIQLDAGTGFPIGGTNGYANVYVGFNNRTNGFSGAKPKVMNLASFEGKSKLAS